MQVKNIVIVPRISGTEDRIKIIVDKKKLENSDGKFVDVTGRLCSFAHYDDDDHQKSVERYIFVEKIHPYVKRKNGI